MYSQLFSKKPTDEAIIKLLNCFGLSSLEDQTEFTFKKLDEFGTIDKYKEIEDELAVFYFKCKAVKYLKIYDYKKIMTVLRQFIKIKGYTTSSIERCKNKTKHLIYKLVPIVRRTEESATTSSEPTNNDEYVVSFN